MPPAVRLSDKASCSADKHGCPACPHPTVGPAVNGSPDVFVNKRPAIRLGDPGIHMACCGPNQWKVAKGSSTVYVNGKPLARMGDKTTHCGGSGKLINGSSNVFADDSGAGAGGLKALIAAALAAGKALLDEWTAEEKKISSTWDGKDSKGAAGKAKSGSGKAAKGKSGGGGGGGAGAQAKGGGGAAGPGADAAGADGAGAAAADDLSSDEGGAEAGEVAGVGVLKVNAPKTSAKPDTKLAFSVECKSSTTGSVVVGLVLTDGDGQEQVLKKTSVEAKLNAAGSLKLPKIAWPALAKKYKLAADATSLAVKLKAEHPSGPAVFSAEITISDDAVDNGIVLWLYDESADDGDPSDEPNNQRPRKLVEGQVPAKVKIQSQSALIPVVFEDGKAEISGVDLPELPEGVEEGDPDPRVEKVTIDDDAWKQHKSKAFVGKKTTTTSAG